MDPPAVPPHIDDHALGTLRSVLFLREARLVSAVPTIPSALILLGLDGCGAGQVQVAKMVVQGFRFKSASPHSLLLQILLFA